MAAGQPREQVTPSCRLVWMGAMLSRRRVGAYLPPFAPWLR
jgi:hypothetical protein